MGDMKMPSSDKKTPANTKPATNSMNMPMGKPPIKDPPSQHAYVMVGRQTLFLCHLTMVYTLMPEHMYEFVLEATLPQKAWDTYLEDMDRHPDATYFLGNSKNDQMTLPQIHIGECSSFTANIWRGIPPAPKSTHHYDTWPWTGKKPLIRDTTVTVKRVVRFRHYNFAQDYPSSMTYFLFGKGTEAHMYHYQTREPDFDQVVSLQEAPSFLSKSQLQSGVLVNIPTMASTPAPCSNPLTEKTYHVQYEGISDFGLHEINIDRSVWFSTEITNSYNPCFKPRKKSTA